MPESGAIRQCNEILTRATDDRGIELPIAHALAHMHARLGDFELARSMAARYREIAPESGQRSLAALLTEVVADVEMLAGDPDAAERILGEGCDWFIAMGKPHMVLEALHALTQVAARPCRQRADPRGRAAHGRSARGGRSGLPEGPPSLRAEGQPGGREESRGSA
jgi:hypothetical protein